MNAESIVTRMPVWFPRLMTGPPVFGKRKDRLIIEVFDLGGMDLLESRCGLQFLGNDSVPDSRVEVKQLIKIRNQLLRERKLASSVLRNIGNGKSILTAKALKPGVFSLKIVAKQAKGKKRKG